MVSSIYAIGILGATALADYARP